MVKSYVVNCLKICLEDLISLMETIFCNYLLNFLLCFLSEQLVAFVLITKLDLWRNLDCNVVLYMYQMWDEIR